MNLFLLTTIPILTLVDWGAFSLDSWMFWLILVIILILIEANTAMLLTVWFVGGAILALIASLLNFSIPIQIAVFVVFSVIFLLVGLRLRTRLNIGRHKRTPTNADRLIGQIAIVTIPIDPIRGQGQVKVSGMFWSAITEHKEEIPIGDEVRINAIVGNKLIVEAIPANTK